MIYTRIAKSKLAEMIPTVADLNVTMRIVCTIVDYV